MWIMGLKYKNQIQHEYETHTWRAAGGLEGCWGAGGLMGLQLQKAISPNSRPYNKILSELDLT
jgi:hypothetical protein